MTGVLLALGASGQVDVTAQTVFAAALLVVAVVLVLATWAGRARGLIVAGMGLTVALVIAATLDVPLSGGIGDRTSTLTTAADTTTAIRLGVGQQTVDLTGLELGKRPLTVHASVGIGRLHVWVPPDARVVVHAHNGAGRITINDFAPSGWRLSGSQLTKSVTLPPVSGQARGEIDLDVRVGVGELDVEQQGAAFAPAIPLPAPAPATPVPPALGGAA